MRAVPGERNRERELEESTLANASDVQTLPTLCARSAKMVLFPVPQTFTTFATFAKFAKFAKFANIDFALEHPPPIHHHPPRLRSISERAAAPLPSQWERGWGEGFLRAQGGQGTPPLFTESLITRTER